MRRLAFTFAASLLASPAAAQTITPIAKLACTAANYPACGADGHDFRAPSSSCTGAHCQYGRAWEATFLPGAGPEGQPVVRIHLLGIPNATTNDEFYWGWGWSLANQPAVAQGVAGRRFVRVLMRIWTPTNWIGPGGGRVGGKFVILGADGTPAQWRMLWNLRSNLTGPGPDGDHDPSHAMFRTERNISAGRIDNRLLPIGQWLRAQLEVTPSSTPSATDATLRMYLNQGNRATPTVQSTGYNWQPTGWGGTSDARISLGAYWQAAGVGSDVWIDLAAFEYDDEWDPTWHQAGPVTPPLAAPSGVRVLP